ncbi:hypothetical protein EOW77_0025570 [Bradyrhizobium yuanmingense]|nr:hypothetical protein EOW77_0025570 [Bradyrhizobium yuanmingense]
MRRRRGKVEFSDPPLEGEGQSRAARAGWGDLSTRVLLDPPRYALRCASCVATHGRATLVPDPSRGG